MARYPLRHACCASAQATYVLPVPVEPVTTTFWRDFYLTAPAHQRPVQA
jgi:hypothetical protein